MDVHAGVSEFFSIYNKVAGQKIAQYKVVPVDIFHDYEFEEYKYPWPFSNRFSGYLVMRRLMRDGSLVICRSPISEEAWREWCPANFQIASNAIKSKSRMVLVAKPLARKKHKLTKVVIDVEGDFTTSLPSAVVAIMYRRFVSSYRKIKIMSEFQSEKHREANSASEDAGSHRSFRTMDADALKIARCFDDVFDKETMEDLRAKHHASTVFDIMPEHVAVTGYGSLHNAILRGERCLAVVGDGSEQEYLERFKEDLKLHASLSHPCVVQYYGCHVDRGIRVFFIEAGDLGNLEVCLQDPSNSLTLTNGLLSIAKNILTGLGYLHSLDHHPNFAHGEVQSQNVQVRQNLTALLAGITASGSGRSMGGDRSDSNGDSDGKVG